MTKKDLIKIIIILVIAFAFTIYCIIFNTAEPVIVYDLRVPPAPKERFQDSYWEWNSDSQTWVLKTISSDRAKAIIKPELDEDALQEYLEKHIDGYLEDTYWGEEYDLTDKDNDDNR